MQFQIENLYIIFAVLAFVVIVGIFILRFATMPKEERRSRVLEWLLWAVAEAERALGGGTGKLKLRQVYDRFIVRFPWLSKILTFKRFMKLVDDALKELDELLKNNKAVKEYVEGAEPSGN